ncbi:MAG: diacylglycerol kinase family protein [Saprospiraceae bacterium]|nr:diacylglycerol kinase family protein [Saprospiraceae bacterium]
MKRFFNSFGFAIEGLQELFANTPNSRVHLGVGTLVIIAGWYYHVSKAEWLVLILCIGLVIAFEALNTALEHLTDLAHPDHHPLAKKAKDVSAGAVLLMALTAAACGLVIFLPKIL